MPCVEWVFDQKYHCLKPNHGGGSDILYYTRECEAGCRVCDDHPDLLETRIHVARNGRRWMRPHQEFESRDAWGRYHFLNSNEPWLVQPIVAYQLANCYRIPGHEFWDKTLCECPRGILPPCYQEIGHPHPPFPPGQVAIYFDLARCLYHRGAIWFPNPRTLPQCSTEPTHAQAPATIGIGSDGDPWNEFEGLSPAFFRAGHSGHHTWCFSNFGLYCYGHITPHGLCPLDLNGDPGFYIQDSQQEGQSLWDFLRVKTFNGALLKHDENPFEDKAEIDAKNAALSFLSADLAAHENGVMRIDQLSNDRRFAAPDINTNHSMNYWFAEYRAEEADGPTVYTFPQSYLFHSGCPVNAEYKIVKARMEFTMTLERVWPDTVLDPDTSTPQGHAEAVATFPFARVKIDLRMGIKATLPNGECLLEGQPITLSGGGRFADRFPTVSGGSDRICYADDQGRAIIPPTQVRWYGYMGYLSDPPSTDIYSHAYEDACCILPDFPSCSGFRQCCAVAHGLKDFTVNAWPTHPDLHGQERFYLYGGAIKVLFPNFNQFCRFAEPSPCIGAIS